MLLDRGQPADGRDDGRIGRQAELAPRRRDARRASMAANGDRSKPSGTTRYLSRRGRCGGCRAARSRIAGEIAMMRSLMRGERALDADEQLRHAAR